MKDNFSIELRMLEEGDSVVDQLLSNTIFLRFSIAMDMWLSKGVTFFCISFSS